MALTSYLDFSSWFPFFFLLILGSCYFVFSFFLVFLILIFRLFEFPFEIFLKLSVLSSASLNFF